MIGLMLGGGFLFLAPVQVVTTTGPALTTGPDLMGGGTMMMSWVVMALVIFVFIVVAGGLALGLMRRANYGRSAPRKRKVHDNGDPFAAADDWTPQDMDRLYDDDLPELTQDDLFVDEKPKRTLEDE
jgi:uncharacterized membrane protein